MSTKNVMRFGLRVLLASLFCVPLASAASGFEVIAHRGVDVDSISREELKLIFLGEKPFWTKGRRVYVARPEDSAPAWREFVGSTLDLTPTDFLNRWRYRLFSGRGIPPKRFEKTELLLRYVSETEGAIGVWAPNELVNLGDKKSAVKVLTIVP